MIRAALFLPLLVGHASGCLFLVSEPPGAEGGGGASTSPGSGGTGLTTTASTATGAEGGGGSGAVAPACTASLTLRSTITRQWVDQLVMAPPQLGVDVFVETPLDAIDALASQSLGNPPAASSPPLQTGLLLSPHPDGGVLAAGGGVTHLGYVGGTALGATTIWSGGPDRDVVQAVGSTTGYYARDAAGRVVALSGDATPPVLDEGPAAWLVGSGESLVWGEPTGAVVRCRLPGCTKKATSRLPQPGATFEALAYDPTSGRYVALVSVASARTVYTGVLVDDETGEGLALAGDPFGAAISLAIGGDHLLVLTEGALHPCCLASLEGSVPCGTPTTLSAPDRLAARADRVVVETRAPTTDLTTFDVLSGR